MRRKVMSYQPLVGARDLVDCSAKGYCLSRGPSRRADACRAHNGSAKIPSADYYDATACRVTAQYGAAQHFRDASAPEDAFRHKRKSRPLDEGFPVLSYALYIAHFAGDVDARHIARRHFLEMMISISPAPKTGTEKRRKPFFIEAPSPTIRWPGAPGRAVASPLATIFSRLGRGTPLHADWPRWLDFSTSGLATGCAYMPARSSLPLMPSGNYAEEAFKLARCRITVKRPGARLSPPIRPQSPVMKPAVSTHTGRFSSAASCHLRR